MASRPANPFDGAQREGRDKTVKWCLWEVLARHYPSGARVAELEKDERLLALRPKMRTAKNLNGQASGTGCSWQGWADAAAATAAGRLPSLARCRASHLARTSASAIACRSPGS